MLKRGLILSLLFLMPCCTSSNVDWSDGRVGAPSEDSAEDNQNNVVRANTRGVLGYGFSWPEGQAPTTTEVREGGLDTAFADNGRLQSGLVLSYNTRQQMDASRLVTVNPDGSFYVMGNVSQGGGFFGTGVQRYFADGRLDTSFGTAGLVSIQVGADDYPYWIGTQPDGKILVTGGAKKVGSSELDSFIFRLTVNGEPDTSFGEGTGVVFHDFDAGTTLSYRFFSLAVHPTDGSIVAVGDVSGSGPARALIAKFDSNGSLDLGFATNGYKITRFEHDVSSDHDSRAQHVLWDSQGRIVVAGYDDDNCDSRDDQAFSVTRLQANGSVDTSFGNTSTTNGYSCRKLYTDSEFPDASTDDRVLDMKILSDGKIVLVGFSTRVVMAKAGIIRFDADGKNDNSFGDHGRLQLSYLHEGGTWQKLAEFAGLALRDDGGYVALLWESFSDPSSLWWNSMRYSVSGDFENSNATGAVQLFGTTSSALFIGQHHGLGVAVQNTTAMRGRILSWGVEYGFSVARPIVIRASFP